MKASYFPQWLARGAIIGLFISVSLIAAPVSAATFRGGDTATVGTNEEVAGDVYDTGSSVSMLGAVHGDFVGAGGSVTVQGPVDQSVLVAGGNLTLLGPVTDDIRAAGGDIIVGGNVKGDVVVAGGMIHILHGAEIGGDVVVAGGTITIDGNVAGKVYARGGLVTINGTVGKGIEAHVHDLAIGSGAHVVGGMVYTADKAAAIASSTKIEGDVMFTRATSSAEEMTNIKEKAFTFVTLLALAKFIGLAIIAILALWLFKGFVMDVTKRALARPGMSGVLGFTAMVVSPVALVIIGITFIGIYLAMGGFFAYMLFLFVGGALTMPVAGAMLSLLTRKTVIVDWKWTLLGALFFFILTFIPLVGWIAMFIIYFITLGAVIAELYGRYEK